MAGTNPRHGQPEGQDEKKRCDEAREKETGERDHKTRDSLAIA
jgi:hypothetical protein